MFCRTSSHSLAGSDVSPPTMNVTLQAGSAIAESVLLRARRGGQSALPVGGSFIVPTTASASGSDVSFGPGGCDAAQFVRAYCMPLRATFNISSCRWTAQSFIDSSSFGSSRSRSRLRLRLRLRSRPPRLPPPLRLFSCFGGARTKA